MAVKPEDIALWSSLLNAAIPGIGAGVNAVIALINLVRRSRGEPENQPADLLLASQVVASIDKAEKPWIVIGEVATIEIEKSKPKG